MRRKMFRTAEILILGLVLSMGMVGCAGKKDGESNPPVVQTVKDSGSNEDVEASGENSSEMPDDSREEGQFDEGADLSGRVVDFSDTGCTITPATTTINEDGSGVVSVAAPGYESEETNIHITYADDVVFQIINFSRSSQTETSREDADKSSIKKETEVNIFGTCQDEKHWTADKVVIMRYQ